MELSANSESEQNLVAALNLDHSLGKAARAGNLSILTEAIEACKANNNFSPFFRRYKSYNPGEDNIFHIAARGDQYDFLAEAMKGLPAWVVLRLMSQPEQDEKELGWNPLHIAAEGGYLDIVQLILEYYQPANLAASKYSSPVSLPWLDQDSKGATPFHVAISKYQEDCALEILSKDVESLPNVINNLGEGPLFLAVRKQCDRVALEILQSAPRYSLQGPNDMNPLHFLRPSSGEVFRKLIEKHRELIKSLGGNNFSVLHSWEVRGILPPELDNIAPELKKDFIDLLYVPTIDKGMNPLHFFAEHEDPSIAKRLVEYCKQASSSSSEQYQVPWLTPDRDGKTPLDMAIIKNRTQTALCYVTEEINSVLQGDDNPLFLAIESNCNEVAEAILDTQNNSGWSTGLTSGGGRNILHGAPKLSEKVATWLIGKLPHLISMKDENEKTPLHEASEAGTANLIESMLRADPSALEKEPLAWVESCKRGHLQAVLAFVNNCSKFTDLCRQNQDTPLHHIQLQDLEKYHDLLKHPVMEQLKNIENIRGETPLHTAIYDRNILFTEALLTKDGVFKKHRDSQRNTATELLVDLCNQNKQWEEMCDRVAPGLKTTYLQNKTNLLEVRNTLSVVAALLATITFTAGFTLPGGFNNNTGEAVFADKAVFLVFLLSDTFAMCCSMLVLVWLIWSMVCDPIKKALLLIDRSVPMLMLALHSTLVAFMTGVYTVIHQKTLWAAVVILVMCSVIIIASNRSVVYKIFDKLSANSDKKDIEEIRLMEEMFIEMVTNRMQVNNEFSLE